MADGNIQSLRPEGSHAKETTAPSKKKTFTLIAATLVLQEELFELSASLNSTFGMGAFSSAMAHR